MNEKNQAQLRPAQAVPVALTRTVKNGEGRLAPEQREVLTYDNPMLVPCTLEQQSSEYILTFAPQGLRPFSDILGEDSLSRYRLAINCAQLETLAGEYVFSLDPENLMYDINLLPRVLLRDASMGTAWNFARAYKALVASVLCPSLRYQDFFQGGEDLYAQQKELKLISQLHTPSELSTYLTQRYHQESRRCKQEKRLVDRRAVLTAHILIPALAVALIITGVFCFLAYQRQIPLRDAQIQANSDYLAGNYTGVADDLAGYPTDQLPLESRYILARSYISTEGLTDAQKENNLQNLTLKTDDAILNFWIELGRNHFDSIPGAVDYAQKLNNDDLLLFALIKKEAVVEGDSTLSGEEKTTQLKELKQQIEDLTQKIKGNGTTDTATTATDTAAAGEEEPPTDGTATSTAIPVA